MALGREHPCCVIPLGRDATSRGGFWQTTSPGQSVPLAFSPLAQVKTSADLKLQPGALLWPWLTEPGLWVMHHHPNLMSSVLSSQWDHNCALFCEAKHLYGR